VSTFNSFDEQITITLFFSDGGISTVGQRTSTADAKSSYVVRMLTEVLSFAILVLKEQN